MMDITQVCVKVKCPACEKFHELQEIERSLLRARSDLSIILHKYDRTTEDIRRPDAGVYCPLCGGVGEVVDWVDPAKLREMP